MHLSLCLAPCLVPHVSPVPNALPPTRCCHLFSRLLGRDRRSDESLPLPCASTRSVGAACAGDITRYAPSAHDCARGPLSCGGDRTYGCARPLANGVNARVRFVRRGRPVQDLELRDGRAEVRRVEQDGQGADAADRVHARWRRRAPCRPSSSRAAGYIKLDCRAPILTRARRRRGFWSKLAW